MSKLDLPLRFMDFFFECGLQPDVELLEKSIVVINEDDVKNQKKPAEVVESKERKSSITPIKEVSNDSEPSPIDEDSITELEVKSEDTNEEGYVHPKTRESLRRRSAFRASKYTRMSGLFSPEEFEGANTRRASSDTPSEIYVPPRRTSIDARRMSKTRRPSNNSEKGSNDKLAISLQSGSENQRKIANGGHPLHWSYEPETICRYPKEDYSDCKFPEYLPMFCFPNALKMVYDDNGRPGEKFHSFIITEETGAKLYGVCVTVYEPLPQAQSKQLEALINIWKDLRFKSGDLEYIISLQAQLSKYQEILLHAKMGMVPEAGTANNFGTAKLEDRKALRNAEDMVKHYSELLKPLSDLLVDSDNVYCPRNYGLLSHWPFYDFMKDWLLYVVKSTRGDVDMLGDDGFIPLERFVVNITQEIPLPPPGRLEICLKLKHFNLYCSRPPLNRIPLIKNYSFYPLFRALSIENIVSTFESVLNERKIIILSSHLSMLNTVAEAMCTVIFPFYWQHIYIPVLPEKLLTYLQAPMPYIIGVQRDYFGSKQQNEWKPSDAVVIDLDYNIITGEGDNLHIPTKDRKKLLTRLEAAVGLIPNGNNKARRFERGIPISSQYALPFEKFSPHCQDSEIHKYAGQPMESPPISHSNSVADFSDTKRTRESTVLPQPTPLGASHISGVSSTSIESFSSSWLSPSSDTKSIKDRRQSTLSIATHSSRNTKLFGRSNQPLSPVPPEFSERDSTLSRSGSTYSIFRKTQPPPRLPTGNNSNTISSVFDPSSEGGMLSSITRDGHHFIQVSLSGSDTQSILYESGNSADSSSVRINEPNDHFGSIRAMTMKKFSHLKAKTTGSSSRAANGSTHSLHDNDGPSLVRSPSISSKMVSNTSLNVLPPMAPTISDIKATHCSICYRNLSLDGQGGMYKCEDCNFVIHGNCLTITDSRPCPSYFKENRIQDSFISLFVSLIKNYRQYLIPLEKRNQGAGDISDMPLQEDWFKKNDFINSFEKENRPFIQMLCETQGFVQFTLEHAEKPENDHEVLFFDELIKTKKNRSKLKLTKLDTPFINDTHHDISRTVNTLTPNVEGLLPVTTKGLRVISHFLDDELISKPRSFEPLVSEIDHKKMRSMTNEIIQRARLAANTNRKQDISKWMKTKWKGKSGTGDSVLLAFLTDEQRKDLFEERLAKVSQVVDNYEALHINDLALFEIENALEKLHEQNMILMRATDEEQLVDVSEQEDLQTIYGRLFRVITIFEDRKESLHELLDAVGFAKRSPTLSEVSVESEAATSKNSKRDGIINVPNMRNRLVLPKIDAHSSFDNLISTQFVTATGGSHDESLTPRIPQNVNEQPNAGDNLVPNSNIEADNSTNTLQS